MPNHCCIFIRNIWMLVKCIFKAVKKPKISFSSLKHLTRAREVSARLRAVRRGASLTTGGPPHIWRAAFVTTKLARWELPWWTFDSLHMLKRESIRRRSRCLGERWRKQQTKQIRNPSLHLLCILSLFHRLSGNFDPSVSLVESSVCLTCIKQSNYSEMIENAFKCSELEQLSSLFAGRSTGLCSGHQIRAYQMMENFTGCWTVWHSTLMYYAEE